MRQLIALTAGLMLASVIAYGGDRPVTVELGIDEPAIDQPFDQAVDDEPGLDQPLVDDLGFAPLETTSDFGLMDPAPDMTPSEFTLAREAAAADQAPQAASLGLATDFTLTDQDGKQVSLSDFCGQIVVLEWVNPVCPFVQRHYRTGTMANLACQYGGSGVVWLSINSTRKDSVDTNRKWAEEQGLFYPILDDHDATVARAYGAKVTPHMFIIDAAGNIVYRGAIDDDPKGDKTDAVNYVEKALKEVLADQPVSIPETTAYGCTVKYTPAK